MESVVIRKTHIEEAAYPTGIVWSPIASLIALAFSPKGPFGRVLIFELDTLHENVVLEIPFIEEGDEVQYVDFSPTKTPLTLLTATRQGSLYLWTPRQESSVFRPLAVNTWSATKVHPSPLPSLHNVGSQVELQNEGEIVYCKFLSPTPMIRWPPKPPSNSDGAIVSLDSRFVHQDHIIQGDTPWLRTGHLCLMIIDSTGHFQIHWKSLTDWIPCEVHSLEPHVSGPLLVADVISSIGSSLRMAVVCEAQPTEIVLLDIKGHISSSENVRDSIEVERISVSTCSVEHPVCFLQFQQYLLGKILIVLQRTPDWIAVTKHEVSSTSLSFSETQRKVFKTPTLTDDLLKQASICQSIDGSNLVLCIPKTDPVIVSLGTMKHSMRLKSESLHCTCAVYSPNGVNLATVEKVQNGYLLQIWTLPESSISSNVAKNDQSTCCWDSIRVNWSMVKMTDPWDICQRIKENAKVLPEAATYRSLFQMDRILDKHPYFCRPDYSEALDRIKISILKNTQEASSKVILMDLYSRRIVTLLHGAYGGLFGSNLSTGINQFGKRQWTQADNESFIRWLNWVEKFFRFLCECVRTWIARHSSDPTDPTVNHVPLVRLLTDLHFIKRLSMLLYSCQIIGEHVFTCPTQKQEKSVKFRQYCTSDIHQIHTIVKSANDFGPEAAETQSVAFADAFIRATMAIRETFKGPIHLHYARVDGSLTPEVLHKMSKIEIVKESKILTDDEIEDQALSLGLLPDTAIRGFLRTQQRSFFTGQKIPTKLELPIFDCLKGRSCVDHQGVHYASDLSCLVTFQALSEGQNGGQSQGRLDEILQKNVTTRSPFTGSMWKQAYSSQK